VFQSPLDPAHPALEIMGGELRGDVFAALAICHLPPAIVLWIMNS
jgi:hypothetical protein